MDLAPQSSHSPPSQALELCAALARERFQIQELHESQKRVLEALLESPGGVLATLPTGAGKTLLYTLPALLWNEPVLVVCPLISLMRDQARRMEAANISCAIFTSEQSEEERRIHYARLVSGEARLVFASPERLVLPSFVRLLAQRRLSMAVVDEAHCVAAWGPSFRPEYAEIGRVLTQLNPRRILALTATASRPARRIIREKVFPPNIRITEVLQHPLRKNIHVTSERLPTEDEKWRTLVLTLSHTESQKSIVYFPRRDMCSNAALALRKAGLHAVAYHAGLSREERQSVEAYVHASREKLVICATQAFGMGVDVADVRLVTVFGFPSGIEDFFQMIGRAGRGGEPAQALLLWTGADPKKRQFQFDISYPDGEQLEAFLADLSPEFPKPQCRRIVSEQIFASHLRIAPEKAIRATPGIITALRLMDALELPFANEPYVSLELGAGATLEKLLAALPPGPTRRSQLLTHLRDACGLPWAERSGAATALPARLLCDGARISWEQCEEVLNHYRSTGALEWTLHSVESMRDKYILSKTWNDARSALPRYLRLRSEFLESLRELEKLAKSTTCRLAESHSFFASAPRAAHIRPCGQCDLCHMSLQSS